MKATTLELMAMSFRIPSEELKRGDHTMNNICEYCFRIPSEELKQVLATVPIIANAVLEYLVRN